MNLLIVEPRSVRSGHLWKIHLRHSNSRRFQACCNESPVVKYAFCGNALRLCVDLHLPVHFECVFPHGNLKSGFPNCFVSSECGRRQHIAVFEQIAVDQFADGNSGRAAFYLNNSGLICPAFRLILRQRSPFDGVPMPVNHDLPDVFTTCQLPWFRNPYLCLFPPLPDLLLPAPLAKNTVIVYAASAVFTYHVLFALLSQFNALRIVFRVSGYLCHTARQMREIAFILRTITPRTTDAASPA